MQKDVCERSMKLYRKTRPSCGVGRVCGISIVRHRVLTCARRASLESIRRSKLLNCDDVLPVFSGYGGTSAKHATSREAAVAAIRGFRAKATIFEALGNT